MQTFKIYSLINFQLYTKMLLTIHSRLSISSPKLIYLITGGLYTLTTLTHSSHPQQPSLYLWFLWVWIFFFNSTYKWDHMVFVFLWLTSVSIQSQSSSMNFLLIFYDQTIFHSGTPFHLFLPSSISFIIVLYFQCIDGSILWLNLFLSILLFLMLSQIKLFS